MSSLQINADKITSKTFIDLKPYVCILSDAG